MAKKATARKKSTGTEQATHEQAAEEESVRYGEAVEEIERILESIDRDQIDVDDLSVKVERAVNLIRVCEKKLRSTEMRVREVLADLDAEGEAPGEESLLTDDSQEEARAAESNAVETRAVDTAAEPIAADDDELPPLPADDELPF